MKARVRRLRASLTGLPPEQLPLLVSVGLVLGVFPVAGCPTLLCLVAAFGLRLNLPALQVLNNLSSPLQLALLLPLARAGAGICRASAPLAAPTARGLALAALHAIAGWAFICIPLGVFLYFVLAFTIRAKGPVRRAGRYPIPAFRT